MENKQAICDKLTETLKLTRHLDDISKIEYVKKGSGDEECVIYLSQNGHEFVYRRINVSMDSGYAMVKDIMKNID